MQLLCQIDTANYDQWKADYDAHAENRDAAGMTQMQIWRDADVAGRVVVLFDVHDRAKVQAWIKTQSGLGAKITAQFLRTA